MTGKATGPSVGFLLLSSVFVVIWGLLAGVRLLWAIIKHPVESFKKSPRNVAPACLSDKALGTHEYVRANGLKFHCVRSGERSKPLMLLLHGFPEVKCKINLFLLISIFIALHSSGIPGVIRSQSLTNTIMSWLLISVVMAIQSDLLTEVTTLWISYVKTLYN